MQRILSNKLIQGLALWVNRGVKWADGFEQGSGKIQNLLEQYYLGDDMWVGLKGRDTIWVCQVRGSSPVKGERESGLRIKKSTECHTSVGKREIKLELEDHWKIKYLKSFFSVWILFWILFCKLSFLDYRN